MVTIMFPDHETEERALGFLLGRFSGRLLRSREHIVPEEAVAALADQNITFTVLGKATHQQYVAALKGNTPTPEELRRRARVVAEIEALRNRLAACYGEMPDSTALIREDRER